VACTSQVICEGDACGQPGGGGSGTGGSGAGSTVVQPPIDLTRHCENLCCGACSPGEIATCEDELGTMQVNGEAAGCNENLGQVDQCIGTMTCDSPMTPSCENVVYEYLDCAVGAQPPPPPSGSLCDLAEDLCGIGFGGACDPEMACIAECVLDSDCFSNDVYFEQCASDCN
jgi:hypothetical protein